MDGAVKGEGRTKDEVAIMEGGKKKKKKGTEEYNGDKNWTK